MLKMELQKLNVGLELGREPLYLDAGSKSIIEAISDDNS